VSYVIKNFHGEKNGNLTGKMFYIALKDAEEIKRLMIKLNLSNALIALGSIPFVFLSILGLNSLDSFLGYNLEYLASLYTLIITCFICGTHWGIYLNNQKIKINLFFLRCVSDSALCHNLNQVSSIFFRRMNITYHALRLY